MADEDKTLIEIQLEKEEAAAEEVRKAMYEGAPAAADTPDPDAPPEDLKDGETETTEEVETKEADAPEEPPAEEEEEAKKEGVFEKKYNTLKGKYDKELPKALSELKTSKTELKQWQSYATGLEQKVLDLESKLKSAPATPDATEEKPTKKPKLDLADPELATLLQDYPGMQKLLSSLEAKSKADEDEIAALRAQIDASGGKIKDLESDVVETKASRFETDMVRLAGADWRSTDSDPKFLEWLGEEIPYTGKTKLQLLQNASATLDAATVAKFFNDYKQTLTSETEEADTGAETVETPPGKLNKQVAPPRSNSAAAVRKTGAESGLTVERYKKFMDETTRGRYKPEEWGGKTEAQMDAIFNNALAKHELR